MFNRDFSRAHLLITLIRYSAWSGFNMLILCGIRYLDNNFLVSDNWLSALLIPVGLINCAVFVSGFVSLRVFYWKTMTKALFSSANFLFFLYILNGLYSQSGPLLN